MTFETGSISSAIHGTGISNDKFLNVQNKTDNIFSVQLKEYAIENVKNDIYEKFGIHVNASDNKEECIIPTDVLYRMNSDSVLREKVYAVLAEHKNTKCKLAGFYPPVKKYTLMFDKKGNVITYTLEPDMELLEKDYERSGKENQILFDSVSLDINDYIKMINDILCDSYQSMEMKSELLAANLIKKVRKF